MLGLGRRGSSTPIITVPTVFWALSADKYTVETILWAVSEYAVRMGSTDLNAPNYWQDIPVRAQAALKVLYEFVNLRTPDTSWRGAAFSDYRTRVMATPKDNERVTLARRHESPVSFTTTEGLEQFLKENTPQKDVQEKPYLEWWSGDMREFLVLIHLVGKFATEKWQWPPSAAQRSVLLSIASVYFRGGKPDLWVHHAKLPFVVYVSEAES